MLQLNIVHYILVAGVVFVLLLIILSPHERHKMIDGKLHKAWHIQLPGYVEVFYPESIIQLKDWVGSGISGITVAVDDQRNLEIEAEPALRMIGLATPEHVREELDGHWILRKSEKTIKLFSWAAYYRISKYVLDEK